MDITSGVFPLGFGLMRVPVQPGGTFGADVYGMIDKAYESGINFFDTAYLYLGGKSETLVRDALVARYPRGTFYISDKLPLWECKAPGDMERIFRTQLERLGTDYIDFYLLHGLNRSVWEKAAEFDALNFLTKKKRDGYIRSIGFSFHDEPKVLQTILNGYEWEFALLQINYYDWFCGQAKPCYDMLEEKGISCMVMEPLGGGRLVRLPKNAEQIITRELPGHSPASAALCFAAGLPNVAVTLSGMTSGAEIDANLAVFNNRGKPPVNHEIYGEIVKIINEKRPLPCSGCLYCLDKCPAGADIPQIFGRYIEYKQFDDSEPFDLCYFLFIDAERTGGKCSGCGGCSNHCPQKINIPAELARIHNEVLVLFLGDNPDNIKKRISEGMKLVLFGAGKIGKNAALALLDADIVPYAFCDNREELWGSEVSGIKVISPVALEKLYAGDDVGIAVATFYRNDVRAQLKEKGMVALN